MSDCSAGLAGSEGERGVMGVDLEDCLPRLAVLFNQVVKPDMVDDWTKRG